MRRLTGNELRQLARDARRGSLIGRAAAELRALREASTLTPPKLASLQSARAIVAEQDGDHAAELAVLDEILAAHGVTPETTIDAARPVEDDAPGPSEARRRPRRPFELW